MEGNCGEEGMQQFLTPRCCLGEEFDRLAAKPGFTVLRLGSSSSADELCCLHMGDRGDKAKAKAFSRSGAPFVARVRGESGPAVSAHWSRVEYFI